MRIIIIGAGGHGQVVADIVRSMPASDRSIEIVGYLDDRFGEEDLVADFPILGVARDLDRFPHDGVVVAIGDNRNRQVLFADLLERGEQILSLRHSSSVVSPRASLGSGTMISAGVIVNPGTVVGENVILNTGATIDHHNRIGSHAHIAPGAHLGGDVRVGEGALIGIGACILPGIQIGAWSVVGAGSVVTSDLPPGVTAFGVPAKTVSGTKAAGDS